MSEKPAEWCRMLPLLLTSCTPKVIRAFALVGGWGWPASGDSSRSGRELGHEPGQLAGPPGVTGQARMAPRLLMWAVCRCGAVKKDRDIGKEQGGKRMYFLLNMVHVSVDVDDSFSFPHECKTRA